MTPRQTIEIKQSERRERINALLGQTERSDDEGTELAKLTGEYQTGEVELRAAITVEPDETTTTTKPDRDRRGSPARRAALARGIRRLHHRRPGRAWRDERGGARIQPKRERCRLIVSRWTF